MSEELKVGERRDFGRRELRVHGVAYVPGRPPAYCTVRNLSEQGALLEFNEPLVTAQKFRLVVESKDFEVMCEARHHRRNTVGVLFDVVVEDVIRTIPRRVSGTELREAIFVAVA